MPFTPSHAVVALAFRRTPLSTSAVAVGAMAPDLLYFQPLGTLRDATHSIAGAPTVDLVIAAAAWLVWTYALRRPAADLAPAPIRHRVAIEPIAWSRRFAVIVVVSLLIGIATHLAWDSFTHPDGLQRYLGALRTPIGPLPLYKALQHASSIVGLAVIAGWAVRHLRSIAPRRTTDAATARERATVASVLASVFAVTAAATFLLAPVAGVHPLDPVWVFVIARVSIGSTLAAVALTAVWWWLVARGRPTASPALPASPT